MSNSKKLISNGIEELNLIQSQQLNIKTGIESLDQILFSSNHDGTMQGKIIEICGKSGVGKTQLCYTLALNITGSQFIDTLYIDTNCDISVPRFIEILNNSNYGEDVMNRILENVKFECIFDAVKLIEMLHELSRSNLKHFRNLKLLIIDCLPSIFSVYDRDQNNEKRTLILKLSRLLKRLAYENQMLIFVVNFTKEILLNDSSLRLKDDNDKNIKIEAHLVNNAVGKHWHYIPNLQISITMENIRENLEEYRKIYVRDCNSLKILGCCRVEINKFGVT